VSRAALVEAIIKIARELESAIYVSDPDQKLRIRSASDDLRRALFALDKHDKRAAEPECNADEGHPCDAGDDGEPCSSCRTEAAVWAAELRRNGDDGAPVVSCEPSATRSSADALDAHLRGLP
jgi:hypothetical protein